MPSNNPNVLKNLRPFRKGKGKDRDPRINTKGTISTRPDLVAAIERAANMKLFNDNGKPLILDGEQVTRLDAVIRTAFTGRSSSDKRFLIWLLEFWHGKPVALVDVTSAGQAITKIVVEYVDGDGKE
jgi:hypothetical protein